MAETGRKHASQTGDSEEPTDDSDVEVTVHRTSPDRVVFTEDGNSDGWIATDLAVDLRR